MKKTITFLLLFLGSFYLQAQIDTKVFTLDLGKPHKGSLRVQTEEEASDSTKQSKSKQADDDDDDDDDDATIHTNKKLVIKSRELLAFNLINGNPYKYSYNINHKLVNFFEGQVYNPLDSVGKRISATPKNIAAVVPVVSEEAQKLDDSINQLHAKNQDLLEKIGDTKTAKSDKDQLEKQVTANYTAIGKLQIQKKQLESQTPKAHITKSQYSANFITNAKLKYSLKTVKAIPAQSDAEDAMNIQNAILVLEQSFTDLSIDLNNYVAAISAEDFLDPVAFKAKRESFNATYIQLLKDLQGITSDAINFPDIMKDFKKNTQPITDLSKGINDEIKKMYQLKLYNYLLPLDSNGKNIDAVEITVERSHKGTTPTVTDSYTYTVWVKDGLKIDVSGGLFITSLLDQEYETRDVAVTTNGTTETQKAIYEKNQGDYDFGFGSSINLSLRGGSWVRPALSVGALFTANQKFQILAGGGLILGKEERIVLHGGLTMGAVTTIADGYATDGSASYDLGTNGTVPTSNKFSFGHFFGITYNFGKVKKQSSQPNP